MDEVVGPGLDAGPVGGQPRRRSAGSSVARTSRTSSSGSSRSRSRAMSRPSSSSSIAGSSGSRSPGRPPPDAGCRARRSGGAHRRTTRRVGRTDRSTGGRGLARPRTSSWTLGSVESQAPASEDVGSGSRASATAASTDSFSPSSTTAWRPVPIGRTGTGQSMAAPDDESDCSPTGVGKPWPPRPDGRPAPAGRAARRRSRSRPGSRRRPTCRRPRRILRWPHGIGHRPPSHAPTAPR